MEQSAKGQGSHFENTWKWSLSLNKKHTISILKTIPSIATVHILASCRLEARQIMIPLASGLSCCAYWFAFLQGMAQQ